MRTLRFSLMILLAWPGVAQQPPCTQAIPVNVILPDAALIRKLSPEAFAARNKRGPVQIQSLADDSGPRRIVFVAEIAKSMPAAARQIEASVISAVMANGRAQDSFAFLTARGPQVKLEFGTPRPSLLAAAQELRNPPNGKAAPGGILDAIVEATMWFQQPQPGDSIFLMTMGLENPSNTSFYKARDAVVSARIRLFGYLLGGYIPTNYDWSGAWFAYRSDGLYLAPDNGYSRNVETIFALAQGSGGVIAQENTASESRQYKLSDERVRRLERQAVRLYGGVTEFYTLQLASMDAQTVIELAGPVRQKFPRAGVIFPRAAPDCGQAR
ncbi:MAG TPA: hypothetical protein VFM21_00815 [Terriglobia bacterium]|nr:hypothetical protein [Terriglobia bacterium]